jgi:ABC-type dipeptide/oligopeptide/nickel transport system permease subunit
MTYTGKRFGRNHAGRDLIVGDIHGHYTRLVAALSAIGFDAGMARVTGCSFNVNATVVAPAKTHE